MADTSTALRPLSPVLAADLFLPLHGELIALLRGLEPADWDRPTVCALWSVRDVAAHLLDDDLRRLSSHRDGHRLPSAPDEDSYPALLAFINRLNGEWIAVARRMSPRVLTDLLEFTGPQVAELFRGLDPFRPAHFPVAWAGEDRSENWFDVGRDYTERWLHQQQIRDAVGAPGLLQRRWLRPVLDLFVRALPYTYREVKGEEGTTVRLEITGEAGGEWTLLRGTESWNLYAGAVAASTATVTMSSDTAWRLFSKGLKAGAAATAVRMTGDQSLGAVLLGALGVMA